MKNNKLMYQIIVLLVMLIFSVKLINLQIVSNYNYIMRSTWNLQTSEAIEPLRGLIVDSMDKPLVENTPTFQFYTTKDNIIDAQGLYNQLVLLDKITEMNVEAAVNKYEKARLGEKVVFKSYLSKKEATWLLENNYLFPYIQIEDKNIRSYIYGDPFFHLLGYLGELDPKELIILKSKGYTLGMNIGKLGVEKIYDEYLKGFPGKRIIETNAKNKILSTKILQKPVNGNLVKLSVNIQLQTAGYELLKGFRGAIVISNVKTGEIIALVSSPSINPNLFIKGISNEQFNSILNDPNNPFLYRPISAEYPAASTYKMMMTLIGLDTGLITPDTKFVCNKIFTLGDREFKCLSHHGKLNLMQAFTKSCNVYFYNTGAKIGVDNIEKYSIKFGFGEKTGIDISNEFTGFVPSIDWKIKKYGETWYDGDTINLSIGQGYMLVTPIQMNMLTAIIANEGLCYQPHLLKEIVDINTGNKILEYEKKVLRTVQLQNQETWKFVKEAMRRVILEGTARYGGTTAHVEIAGKTGTAQTLGDSHSWFTAYGPYDNPEIAVTVMVENAGYGASVAAPIASILFDMYYTHKSIYEIRLDIQKAWYKKYLELKRKGLSAFDEE